MSEFKEKTRNKSYTLCVDHKTFLTKPQPQKLYILAKKAQKMQPVT